MEETGGNRRIRRAVMALALAALAGGAAARGGQSGLSKVDRDLYKRVLADIRDDVEKNYYDPKLRGIDLRARIDEAGSKVAAASSTAEAIDAITGLLFDFNDSHTRFYPPPRATRVEYGWTMAMVGDAPLVVRVEKDSDAAHKGLAVGDRVVTLNRFRPTRDNLWQIRHYYDVVRPQAQQHVVVKKPDGSERTLDIRSRVEVRRTIEILDAIQEAIDDAAAAADSEQPVDPGILVWRMTRFRDSDAMRPHVDKARKGSALVLDLRGNPGGMVDGLTWIIGALFDREVHVMTRVGRKKESRELAKPKGKPFLGKLVVLIDSRSGSAAEILARVVQIEKRGTVIGDRSAGAVMVSDVFPHDFGLGNVTIYATSVTVADVRMSDGSTLEHVGVTPDELLLPTQDDLAAGRDPALARAIALAGGSLSADDAGRLMQTR